LPGLGIGAHRAAGGSRTHPPAPARVQRNRPNDSLLPLPADRLPTGRPFLHGLLDHPLLICIQRPVLQTAFKESGGSTLRADMHGGTCLSLGAPSRAHFQVGGVRIHAPCIPKGGCGNADVHLLCSCTVPALDTDIACPFHDPVRTGRYLLPPADTLMCASARPALRQDFRMGAWEPGEVRSAH
jgi:hypothetical protein